MGDQRKQVKRGEKDENGGQWETGTRGAKECWWRRKQIVRNLWLELDGQRKLDTVNIHVQKEVQAAHLTATRMVQPVLKKEDGVAALAAIW